MVDKYTTAKQITQEYINGDMSEPDFKRKISDVMNIPLPESKESHQIKSILKSEPVHIVRRGTHTTLCSQDGGCYGIRYVWLHAFEEENKKFIIGNKLDTPTCPLCIDILKSNGIEIINNV